jgi:hypothetical protein
LIDSNNPVSDEMLFLASDNVDYGVPNEIENNYAAITIKFPMDNSLIKALADKGFKGKFKIDFDKEGRPLKLIDSHQDVIDVDIKPLASKLSLSSPLKVKFKGEYFPLPCRSDVIEVKESQCDYNVYHYFKIEKTNIELVNSNLVSEAAYSLSNYSNCPNINNYYYKVDSITSTIFEYFHVNNISDLRKKTNTNSKQGSNFARAGLSIATGLPLGNAKKANSNIFRVVSPYKRINSDLIYEDKVVGKYNKENKQELKVENLDVSLKKFVEVNN